MEGQVEYRIGWLSACLMLSIAIVADLVQILFTLFVALAPASIIVTVIAEGCIVLYFFLRGVPFVKGKGALGRILGLFVASLIELVPFLDALPTLTIYTIYSIHSVRKEDRALFRERQAQAS